MDGVEAWEFGRTVRRWRDRVAPEAVGVPAGRRRRASGLRREELAALAGISADYLTRLEQGRATAPSAQVVESLARALRVSDVERDLLYRLAGHAAPGPDVVPSRVAPSVQRLLDRLAHTPVVVYDASWTLVLANAPYNALMGDTTAWRGLERNAVWRNVTRLPSRVVHSSKEQAEHEARLVADLRLTASRYPADHALRRLIADLTAGSPRFAELWDAEAPPPPPDPSRRKTIDHPAVGPLTLDCDTLLVAQDDLRISVYTAEPGTEDADRLELATVLGTQSLDV
ncbi:transcriptional regulator with XRE-family HTH domain [Amycolatopsis lexingtonensis]|uniref:Transcriptional regulator with XRE-family HTH domain n=1 Tax=Amycolatopsis lexingtonensis TaxID=218822 RepID=A0ABR9I8I8_9PSEU|nr:helix-turn-helix transcriptional regulator [Amycolatopsis lexingtonensis]MBE1499473.1 transcriptional regulator with XRE-family HTH domain [Amycolatopsis lexingtonensis]